MPKIHGRIDDDGAIFSVLIAVGEDDELVLRELGLPVPEPYPTTALIDTGASRTVVHPEIIKHLRSPQSGIALSCVVKKDGTEEDVELPLHDLRLFPGMKPLGFDIRAICGVPATRIVRVLIGRDILDQCRLLYDGEKGTFTFSFS